MKLSFFGFENTLEILSGRVSVLQIESIPLFTRVCQSLLGSRQRDCLESFTLWDEKGKEISSKNAFLPIVNPFDLPWRDRGMLVALYGRMDSLIKENETVRREIEEAHQKFESLISRVGFELNSSYSFGLEWELSQALKAYSFGVDRSDSVTLLENLIRFIEFMNDICYRKILLLVNLEKFLTNSELLELESQLFFHDIAALLLIQGESSIEFKNSQKLSVNQEFLECLG